MVVTFVAVFGSLLLLLLLLQLMLLLLLLLLFLLMLLLLLLLLFSAGAAIDVAIVASAAIDAVDTQLLLQFILFAVVFSCASGH